MSALSIQPTYPIFTDIDGQPLEDGFVWLGTANLDPQTNPIAVFFDAALTIPAPQPIRTLAGYPARSGTPARLYVGSNYSIRVMNKNGSVVYSAPDGASDRFSSVQISFLQAGPSAAPTTVEDKLRESVSVKDFGAVGDGVTDDRAAIQAAFDYVASKKGGTVFFPSTDAFYAIKSTHPSYPAHGLVLLPGAGDGDIRLLGNGLGNRVQLDVSAPITSLMYWPVRVDRIHIENMWFDAASLANHVLKADEAYHPYLYFTNSEFRRGITECIRIATFVAVMDRVSTFRGTTGFSFVGITGGPVTGLTLNSCYALQASQYGYNFGFLTYCTLNACACDGGGAGPFDTEVAYNFGAAYGVTMNACGLEKAQRFLRVSAYRGFVVNTAYMLGVGGQTTPVDYVFEFQTGTNATVSGLRANSINPAGFTYLLAQTGSSFGFENITVTDSCADRGNSFWVSNFFFTRPIKFLRGESISKPQTFNFSNAAALRDTIENRGGTGRNFIYDFDVTWQLADGTYDLETGNPFLQDLSGNKTLTIQGNPADNTAVTIFSSFNDFGFVDCNLRIVLKDLTISAATTFGGSTYRLFARNSPNIILDNVRILAVANLSNAMRIEQTSKVQLINGSAAFAAGGNFLDEAWVVDASSQLIIEPASAPPVTGQWEVGNVVYNNTPTAGGNIGWVCTTAGEPGTWKAFGTVAA